MPDFRPGHDAHPIQTRLAFEARDELEVAPLVAVDLDRDELIVRTRQGERRYWCARAADAAAHLDRALAVPDGHLVFLNEGKHLLALVVGDPGAVAPTTLGLVAGVTELEDGAAVAVATTEDGWWGRLYNIRALDEPPDRLPVAPRPTTEARP